MATESFTRKIKISNPEAIRILAKILGNDNSGQMNVDHDIAERIKKCEQLLKENPSQFRVFQP